MTKTEQAIKVACPHPDCRWPKCTDAEFIGYSDRCRGRESAIKALEARGLISVPSVNVNTRDLRHKITTLVESIRPASAASGYRYTYKSVGEAVDGIIMLVASPSSDKFPRGARVRKIKGYRFEGYVLGTFVKCDGVTKFLNVENDDGWVMHFREDQLELIGPSSRSDTARHVDDPLVQGSDGTGVGASSLPTVSPAPGDDASPRCKYCSGKGYVPDDPEEAAITDCQKCDSTGYAMSPKVREILFNERMRSQNYNAGVKAAEARGREAERDRCAKIAESCAPGFTSRYPDIVHDVEVVTERTKKMIAKAIREA